MTDQDVAGLLRDWDRHGVSFGVVTDGREPVSILFRGKRYRAIPPEITPVNPIGSGDSVLAGLVDGWLSGLEPEPLLRHAIACGVTNALVWDAGAIDAERGRPLVQSNRDRATFIVNRRTTAGIASRACAAFLISRMLFRSSCRSFISAKVSSPRSACLIFFSIGGGSRVRVRFSDSSEVM